MPWHRLLEITERLPSSGAPDAWYQCLLARVGEQDPFALAVLGGRLAATPGLAFLAGYQAALRALWPAAPASLGALCVTENRSTRPADLSTRLEGLQLNGQKDFVTAGAQADWLLVAAREEAPGAALRLALCKVFNGAPGVQLEARAALPLMPDISHARLRLTDASCERLPGDGWDDYTKPFRSLEDLYVLAAICAWLLGLGRDNDQWPQPLSLKLLGLLAGCAELARQDHSAASHVLLAGLLAQYEALGAELDEALAATTDPAAGLWQRDRGIMQLARVARARRLEKALERYPLP